jgi:hypothetical protein
MRLACSVVTFTPVAVADTTAFVNDQHFTIQGGVAGGAAAGQRSEVREIYMGGQATASAPAYILFGRTSTAGATLTAGLAKGPVPIDVNAVLIANPPVAYTQSSTKPQRSATLGGLLNLSYNAFGGIVRWYCGPDETISMFGQAANAGELSLNGYTGSSASAVMGAGIVIETV